MSSINQPVSQLSTFRLPLIGPYDKPLPNSESKPLEFNGTHLMMDQTIGARNCPLLNSENKVKLAMPPSHEDEKPLNPASASSKVDETLIKTMELAKVNWLRRRCSKFVDNLGEVENSAIRKFNEDREVYRYSHCSAAPTRPEPYYSVNYRKIDKRGYDVRGYDKAGYDREGYNKAGYDREGYDRDGYDKRGYDRNAYNKDGKYDTIGYDERSYDSNGYDNEGYDRHGFDASGYSKESNDEFAVCVGAS